MQAGFSLIEMLIVVAILGVLSALATVGYRRYVGRARLTEAVTILAEMASKQQIYFLEFGGYHPLRPDTTAVPSPNEDAAGFYPVSPSRQQLRVGAHRHLDRQPGRVARRLALRSACGPAPRASTARTRSTPVAPPIPRPPAPPTAPHLLGHHRRDQPALVLRAGRLQPQRRPAGLAQRRDRAGHEQQRHRAAHLQRRPVTGYIITQRLFTQRRLGGSQ